MFLIFTAMNVVLEEFSGKRDTLLTPQIYVVAWLLGYLACYLIHFRPDSVKTLCTYNVNCGIGILLTGRQTDRETGN